MGDIRKGKLSELTPDKRNANKGTKRGLSALDHSVRQYGVGRGVLVDRNGNIIAGNKTVERLADVGIEDIVIVPTDGKTLVVTQRTDLDLDTDKAARELAYHDNRVGQLDLEWEPDEITLDLANGIELGDLFTDKELQELGVRVEEPKADLGPQIDKAEELREKWGVEPGQLWQLGEHRLICGDCTDRAVVERVMDGEKAALAPVDPPYNVGFEYDGETVDDQKTLEKYEQFSKAWFSLCQMVSDQQLVTPGCYNLAWWLRWFDPYHWGVWTKTNSMTNGRVSRFWCWEPVLFFGEHWGKRRHDDIFNYPIGQQKDVANHPCPKPLEMWCDILENYSAAEAIIYESFSGSGTTLIACERLHRKCRAVEISPAYCAVAIQRWVDMTGQQPILLQN